MRQPLENEFLSIGVETRGAEIQSLLWRREYLEMLWQGDPALWPRRSPVLFPIVGKLNGDRYRLGDREYSLPQHGFARDKEFALAEAGPEALGFLLREDDETLARYPFPFELSIRYSLDGPALHVAYAVRNPGPTPLPFCLGAHPGFQCPLREGERFEDYEFRFEVPETLDRHLLRDGLLAPEPEPFLRGQDRISLSYSLFEMDAIVLVGFRSRWVELRPASGGPSLRVSLEGWPHLGLWTKPGAPFLCIEPWQGLADREGFRGELTQREGVVVLAPGGTFRRGFTIRIPRGEGGIEGGRGTPARMSRG